MAQYHFDLTFDFRNPGDLITSDMAFVGASRVQGYALGHHLYLGASQPVPFDPPDRKSHRFAPGDTVFVRLYALNALPQEAMEPQTLHFELMRLNAQYQPLVSAQAGQTPFAKASGEPIVGQPLGKSSTQYSLTWNLVKSRALPLTGGGKDALPCWVLQRYPASEPTPWTHSADDDIGAPATFNYLSEFSTDGRYTTNRWRFQIWTDIHDNTGASKRFIFDPEMIVDPNL